MRASASIEVAREPDVVFELTTRHVPEWSSVVVADEVINETPEGVGTTFCTQTEERGQRMDFDGEVSEHDPPNLQTVYLKGKYFDIEARYTFDDLGGRTRVTQESTIHPKGAVKLFFLLFGWMMNRASCNSAQQEMERLKRFV